MNNSGIPSTTTKRGPGRPPVIFPGASGNGTLYDRERRKFDLNEERKALRKRFRDEKKAKDQADKQKELEDSM